LVVFWILLVSALNL